MKTYDFRRALDALLQILPEVLAPDAEILWQTGVTNVSGLEIAAHRTLPAAQMRQSMREADLVVAHAGVGSALTALDEGRAPVLLPRLKRYREMVDDHQLMIAAELSGRGLAVSRDPSKLTVTDLQRSMAMGVAAASVRPPFRLIS